MPGLPARHHHEQRGREFPAAFLRRCLRLEMDLPRRDRLNAIVRAHLGDVATEESNNLIETFLSRRTQGDLATDQLLNAIYLTFQGAWPGDREKLVSAVLPSQPWQFVMTAERLADLLHGVGLDPTGHDLLDVLWLASKITPAKVSHQREPGEAAEAEPGNKPRPSGEAERQESDQRGGMPGPSGDSPARADVDPIGALHPRDLSGRIVPREGQASIVRVPAVSILTDQLHLARAMRPLKRKVASRHSTAIDEEATATRIAEEQIWIPAMRPIPTRWLELAVVVDGYESMTIWHQMVNELRGILEGLGAFRDVRFWILDGDASEPARLNVRAWGSDSPLRSARELIDPTGRARSLPSATSWGRSGGPGPPSACFVYGAEASQLPYSSQCRSACGVIRASGSPQSSCTLIAPVCLTRSLLSVTSRDHCAPRPRTFRPRRSRCPCSNSMPTGSHPGAACSTARHRPASVRLPCWPTRHNPPLEIDLDRDLLQPASA